MPAHHATPRSVVAASVPEAGAAAGRGAGEPGVAPAAVPGARRTAYLGLGYACLGLAALGAVLPLMPSTVFLIAAVWAFGRASPALRSRLLADDRVGPALRDWHNHGVVSRHAKRAALLAMAASWIVATLLFRSVTAAVLSGACLAAVGAWLLTRPSAVPAPGRGDASA